ncbi:MAG: AAA family ATPase, partial [Deltaproteobacteria bacterium]|nr:AAA family ATPase [Deltaproteobacteria bacterium]
MLKTLHVTNLGIFEEVEVDLRGGLVCLTGETGAGKSLLLDAIKLLLGARADPSMVRHGEKSAIVEAVFDVSRLPDIAKRLDASGYEPEDGWVTLRRTVSNEGRSRAWIQGRAATARELREIGGDMVSIAGQHAFMSLGVSAQRLAMLDTFGGLASDVARYRAKFDEFRAKRDRLQSLQAAENERAARRDYLEFVIGQIDDLDPRAGENEELESEARVLKAAGRLRELAHAAAEDLFEVQHSAFDSIGRALKSVH